MSDRYAETAPQPVIEAPQPEAWELDTVRIREEVTSIRILIILWLVISTAVTVAALVFIVKAESDLNLISDSGSQQTVNSSYCVMEAC